ncbi:hypothetical protein CRV24_006300 [Beauveria bassiana]|nr:hypothetical protein CRV24_006300 [Beauveria bassiana]
MTVESFAQQAITPQKASRNLHKLDHWNSEKIDQGYRGECLSSEKQAVLSIKSNDYVNCKGSQR